MDQDDPERRIAELERQLAELRPAATTGGHLTAEQVRNVAFSKPPIGQRGYNEDDVDAFLDYVEAALRNPAGHTLTPEQVRSTAFSKPPIGKRGYNENEVDAFLDLVEAQVKSQRSGSPPAPQPGPPPLPDRGSPARHGDGRPQTKSRRLIDAVADVFGRAIDFFGRAIDVVLRD
jgi:DivIVA domain-containing protein